MEIATLPAYTKNPYALQTMKEKIAAGGIYPLLIPTSTYGLAIEYGT